jgi:hypothetical protein
LWNKKVSTRKEGKPEAYWDNWLDRVTRKRNHQMRDGINKAAKLIFFLIYSRFRFHEVQT